MLEHKIKGGKFKDGTEAFEDVGHSMDARDLMKKYQVGVLVSKDYICISKIKKIYLICIY